MVDIDIVVPAYNGAAYIERTLESIRCQTYPQFRCLVIDDRSTDATPKILERWSRDDSRFSWLSKPKHLPRGAGASRQFGLSRTHSEFICWFDSDDIMLPTNLEARLDLLRERPDLDFVAAPCLRVAFDLTPTTSRNNITSADYINDVFSGKVALYTESLWRRSAIDSHALHWNNGYKDDWDFNLQALTAGLRLHALDEVLVWYVKRPDSYMSRRHVAGDVSLALDELRFNRKWFTILSHSQLLNDDSLDHYLSCCLAIARTSSLAMRAIALRDLAWGMRWPTMRERTLAKLTRRAQRARPRRSDAAPSP